MERSFSKEAQSLRQGAGSVFHGEAVVAVAKALLQSGVAYVGGYQGAPVSHLLDVMVDAKDLLDELGVQLETCTNEASAAALLGASINYPARGAVTWKSVVGTNVASDALSNLASAGVKGGALIVVGEDYGEGASVIQERTHAFALKSSIWLLDPRPNLPTIVRLVEEGFALSEVSSSPVMMQLRIRACHVSGRFDTKDNVAPPVSKRRKLADPAAFEYERLAHPPATFRQEKHKAEARLPAAQRFVVERGLNEVFDGDLGDVGLILQGGLYNTLQRTLQRVGLADVFGQSRIPMLVLNVVHPLVPDQIVQFCAGKRAVLILEEGSPEFIEQAINTYLRRADVNTRIRGKDVLPAAGEYNAEVLTRGLLAFLDRERPDLDLGAPKAAFEDVLVQRTKAAERLGELPARPPGFCTGCPERPFFTALKLLQRETGPVHIAADIGCHAFGTFPPFSGGNSILGYGMSLASAAGVAPLLEKRPIAVMGDGGFWHNGLLSGVASSLFNRDDGVLVVLQNGYTSATGIQFLPSSLTNPAAEGHRASIAAALRGAGVRWLRTVRTYSVGRMLNTLREAMRTPERGLKVIIADGECQLARQRRVRAEDAARLARGVRVVRKRYGVDADVCTGDHSCIRLSGCPSLTVRPNPDALRREPIAAVIESCVGCGLCGEAAHAAALCPSFYHAEVVRNPGRVERALHRVRQRVIAGLAGREPVAASI